MRRLLVQGIGHAGVSLKQAFQTVEINYSFYRLPTEDAFERWQEQAPRGFVYAHFNNDAFGYTVEDTQSLQGLLGSQE